ncbi:uncharacterized protein BO97DRAFT_279074 [Aspergillus homomorphus CBS 101889]|uniref:Uncharacterized protein n=1 Tax=Aspergillus homomorphus (strain CBS 101889) TaxID=1450537 RepID=A0A395HH46_ASPHC|nr:hypothetical protein BO97DRAFT_279074 [Aspergillus homomorphus CBS 101889]RAL06813.1 hypothetical protein BO97DRAFT_279074 [Aspergillus homomorphus CBS 101889]
MGLLDPTHWASARATTSPPGNRVRKARQEFGQGMDPVWLKPVDDAQLQLDLIESDEWTELDELMLLEDSKKWRDSDWPRPPRGCSSPAECLAARLEIAREGRIYSKQSRRRSQIFARQIWATEKARHLKSSKNREERQKSNPEYDMLGYWREYDMEELERLERSRLDKSFESICPPVNPVYVALEEKRALRILKALKASSVQGGNVQEDKEVTQAGRLISSLNLWLFLFPACVLLSSCFFIFFLGLRARSPWTGFEKLPSDPVLSMRPRYSYKSSTLQETAGSGSEKGHGLSSKV